MIDENERGALEALDKLGIAYTRYEHPRALTMEDCAHIGEEAGARHFKNLFLTNRQQTVFYIMLISPDKPFRTAEVSKQLGVSRLSFGSEELLMEKLGLLHGSVTPLVLCRECARDVTVVIDKSILDMDMVCAHPCVSTASVALKRSDLMRYIESFGNRVVYVDIA